MKTMIKAALASPSRVSTKGTRPELAEKERKELEILKELAPPDLRR